MRKSLIVSFALHATVLAWALIELPFAREFDVKEVPSLPIDIVTPSEFTKIKAGTKDAKKEEPTAREKPVEKPSEAKKEKPKEVKAARAPAPPPPKPAEPEPAPEPKKAEAPEPAPEPKKAEEPKPEPKPAEKAEGPPPPSPKRAPPKPKTAFKEPLKPEKPKKVADKPERKKSDFSADRIAALLNKVPDAGPKAAPSAAEPQARPEPPARGESSGQDLTMSVNELDALRAKISQCWIPPVGGMGAEQIKVRLRMQLNPDGTLLRQPEIVNRQSSPFFQVAADSAVRAVWQCQPYELSAEKYALWRDMILNFDPREMFGG